MEENEFFLSLQQMVDIIEDFRKKLNVGLAKDKTELACIPTFVHPTTEVKGEALVLDLGGTNYRVAIVNFDGEKPVIRPENGWKRNLAVMKTPGFTRENLFKEMADPILETKRDKVMPIGYCFSYPADSTLDGDATLARWTKGVNINEMVGQPVGKPLVDYLNQKADPQFSNIRVINDTVASLFAGLTFSGYDAYIGLIVGTGTNMATLIPVNKIPKLSYVKELNPEALIPVNLESGNFFPPHLVACDDKVDQLSDKPGTQRFEKAISGMYLGEILKAAFSATKFEEPFDAQKLTSIMNYPDMYKEEYVKVARSIYERSAALVAAQIAGLVLELKAQTPSIKKIMLTADGSLFWSKDNNGTNYKDLVVKNLQRVFNEYHVDDIHVDINSMDNANLIGTAIAALS